MVRLNVVTRKRPRTTKTHPEALKHFITQNTNLWQIDARQALAGD